MAVFSEVVLNSAEGETTKMFNLNTTSLYEIRTMLDIISKSKSMDIPILLSSF